MPILDFSHKVPGPYQTPRYRCWGRDKGVPFTRVYRTLASVKRLAKKPGISAFSYVVIN